MVLITIVFLALLFIIGLLTTFLKFPTKNFTSSFLKTTPSQLVTKEIPSFAQKKVKKSSSTTTQNKAEELRSVFATFDKNKDGFITKQELSESLRNIGISTSERDLVEMVEKVDFNGDGLIDFDEFCELFESMVSQEEEEEEEEISGRDGNEKGEEDEGDLKEAFDVFDGDGDGLITVEELGSVLASLGFKEGKKLEDCKEMIRKVDLDGDGMVNFTEFKSMMKSGGRLISVS